MRHDPREAISALDLGHVGLAKDTIADDEEVELLGLGPLSRALSHRDVPVRLALIRSRGQSRVDDLRMEADVVGDAETLGIGVQVVPHLLGCRIVVGGRRIGVIAEAVGFSRVVRAKARVGTRFAPDPTQGPLLLEQNDLETVRQQHLGRGQASDAGAHDAYAITRHTLHRTSPPFR